MLQHLVTYGNLVMPRLKFNLKIYNDVLNTTLFKNFIYLQSKCIQLHLNFITFRIFLMIEDGVILGLNATYNL